MHEVGIAQNILAIVENEAKKNNAKKIRSVKLSIGQFTGIVKEALEFAIDIVKLNSLAKDADFEIEIIKLKQSCNQCGKEYLGEEITFLCPSCGGVLNILQGKELSVDYIDID